MTHPFQPVDGGSSSSGWMLESDAFSRVTQFQRLPFQAGDHRFRMTVALAADSSSDFVPVGQAQVCTGFPVETTAIFDTGAAATVLPLKLAREIGVQPDRDNAVEVKLATGVPTTCMPGHVMLLLGGNWVKLQCLVPTLPSPEMVPLIGMGGLIQDFMFCLDGTQLTVFKRVRSEI